VRSGFWWGSLRKRDSLEDLGVDRGMFWIDLAQDRDRWRAIANPVTNLQVP